MVLVGKSVISALSVWQILESEVHRRVMLVSATCSLSGAGRVKLIRMVGQLQQERLRAGERGKIVLADASDVGEEGTEAREGALSALAAFCGAKYERLAAPVGKDWNETVVASHRAAQQARGGGCDQPTTLQGAMHEVSDQDDIEPDEQGGRGASDGRGYHR